MRVPNVHCPYSDVADNKRITAATRRISHLGTLMGSRWIVAGHREQGAGRRWRSRKRTTVGHRHNSCGGKTTTCAPPPAPCALLADRAKPARRISGIHGVVDAREHDPRLLVEAARRAAAEAMEAPRHRAVHEKIVAARPRGRRRGDLDLRLELVGDVRDRLPCREQFQRLLGRLAPLDFLLQCARQDAQLPRLLLDQRIAPRQLRGQLGDRPPQLLPTQLRVRAGLLGEGVGVRVGADDVRRRLERDRRLVEDEYEELRRAVADQRRADDHLADAPAAVDDALLDAIAADVAGAQPAQERRLAFGVVGMREVVKADAPQLLARVAGDLAEAVVDVQPSAVAVDERDAHRRLLDAGAEARVAVARRRCRSGFAEQFQQGRMKDYHGRLRSVPARSTSCRRSRRATNASSKPTCSTAATGMAISAPTRPNTVAPIMKATNTVSGEIATFLDITRGPMKRFSIF